MATGMVRWEPFGDVADFRQRLERMFGDLGAGDGRSWMPAVDVVRHDDAIVVRADIPGITPEDVKIEVENEILTVSGTHSERSESEQGRYLRRERRTGSFTRSISLPTGVDAKQIKAVTKDGVVEVTIPIPEQQDRKVTITATAG